MTLDPARMRPRCFAFLLALSLPLAGPARAQAPGGGFVERAVELGLVHEHLAGLDLVGTGNVPMSDWSQSGVALGDLDGDLDLDVVVCGGLMHDRIFLQQNGLFVDVTAGAGVRSDEAHRAPALGDYDGDGDLDLFLGELNYGDGPLAGRSRLYRNEGGARFTDVTPLAGTFGAGHSLHAKWADLDLDGLLDLYVAEFHGTPNLFYRNNGDGTFREMGGRYRLDVKGSAHVVTICDLDRDGLPDGLVGNDWFVSSATMLGQNRQDAVLAGVPGGMVDASVGSGMDQFATTMGLALGDVDYDGLIDVYKTEFGVNFLLLNRGWPNGAGPWVQAQIAFGVVDEYVPDPTDPTGFGNAVGWGTVFADLDLDPWLDLVVINGHVANTDPRNQVNRLFRGLGPSAGFAFADVAGPLGFDGGIDDRGLAVGDVDRDGDVDLLVAPVAGPLRYYENRVDRANNDSIHVRAIGRTSAPGGEGVFVEWTDVQGYPHVRPIGAGAPAASQHANEVVLGLGDEAQVDLSVHFPSGIVLSFPATPAGARLVATEPELLRLPTRVLSLAEAGGQPFVVQAFAHDAAGNVLGPNAQVSLSMPGLAPLGPVTSLGGNAFERAFALPPAAGEFRVEATFDGFQPLVQPRLIVRDRAEFHGFGVRLSPECVRAGSGDTFLFEVAPKDGYGASLGSGRRVTVSLDPHPRRVALTDLGDGRYARRLRAPKKPGGFPLRVWVNGQGGAIVGGLEVAGPAATAPVVAEDPDPLIATSPNQLKFLVTPTDALGRRLGPLAKVELVLSLQPGSALAEVREGVLRGPRNNGSFPFLLERPPGNTKAVGSFEVFVDGQSVSVENFDF